MEEALSFNDVAYRRRIAVAFVMAFLLLIFNAQKVGAQTAVASNSGPICAGDTVRLYETGGDAESWEWSSSGTAVFNNRNLQNPTATGVTNGEVFTVVIREDDDDDDDDDADDADDDDEKDDDDKKDDDDTATATTVVTVFNGVPERPGQITGSSSFTTGSTGVPYTVDRITGAASHVWRYTGTGVTINGNGSNTVTLDFASDATAGQLSVRGTNICGEGIASSLDLSSAAKTLTLSSVLLEGLYSGAGIMRQAMNATGPQYAAGVADHITVELHDANNYSTVVWSLPDVPLSISGTAEINIPVARSGSYYITVRHRNSIETTTASPVSFAGSSISQSFGAPSAVYGGNLKVSGDGFYLVYGGDVNQDGIVDTGDMNLVDNASSVILTGYNAVDVNGDGIVDTSDMNIVDNNSTAIVTVKIPN